MQTTAISCCREGVQVQLLRRCWSELFAVGLAQCSHNIHLSAMLSAIDNHLQTSAEQGDY